jgi:fermentation-respiration switch protein FrsA (DUF1100 family)
LNQRPLLIIAGREDTLVPVGNAENLYLRAHSTDSHAQLWIVEGAGHIQAFKTRPQAYIRRLARFLQPWQSSGAVGAMPGTLPAALHRF